MTTTTDTTTSESDGAGAHVDVNGITLYVETHGEGAPLVLLHGGLGSGEMFGPVLDLLAARRRVVVVDLQGHGRTADIDRPLDLGLMGDDIAALIERLGIAGADVVGYSLGGGVALQVAVRHPEAVGRLVMVSANIHSRAIYPEMRAQQGQVSSAALPFMKDTPMYALYQRVAPRPEDFGRLLDKIGAMMADDFDHTQEVRELRMPTLVVAADADMAPPSHYVEVFGLLDGGQRDGGWTGEGRPAGGHALAILPGQTHYSICTSPLLAASVLGFLGDGPGSA